MAYIPDLPIVEKLRYMCARGVDNMGHPFFASEWMKVATEASKDIEALVKALSNALCELSACAKQMGCREGGSVHQAQEAARAILASVEAGPKP